MLAWSDVLSFSGWVPPAVGMAVAIAMALRSLQLSGEHRRHFGWAVAAAFVFLLTLTGNAIQHRNYRENLSRANKRVNESDSKLKQIQATVEEIAVSLRIGNSGASI